MRSRGLHVLGAWAYDPGEAETPRGPRRPARCCATTAPLPFGSTGYTARQAW